MWPYSFPSYFLGLYQQEKLVSSKNILPSPVPLLVTDVLTSQATITPDSDHKPLCDLIYKKNKKGPSPAVETQLQEQFLQLQYRPSSWLASPLRSALPCSPEFLTLPGVSLFLLIPALNPLVKVSCNCFCSRVKDLALPDSMLLRDKLSSAQQEAVLSNICTPATTDVVQEWFSMCICS